MQQGDCTIEVRRQLRFARVLKIHGADFFLGQDMVVRFVRPARNPHTRKSSQNDCESCVLHIRSWNHDAGTQILQSLLHRAHDCAPGTIVRVRKERTKPLQGKVALITGAARRLGRASALSLAEAGADVAITYLNSRPEAQKTVRDIQSLGVRSIALRCDVTGVNSVRAAVAGTLTQLGSLDILINNAGNYETVRFDNLTLDRWDAIFASNVRGPFLVSKEALPWLRKSRGRIIHLGSLGGIRAWADHAHYCSSKAALHMLTKAMAKALAPEIAVNCVAPGMIDLGEKSAMQFMKRMARETPMRRNGSGEDVAAGVLFFATAPHFITGQILTVDGGLGL
jgi:3-oxoacyl-[acyl-carrier protein] reductase/pteridine reductase